MGVPITFTVCLSFLAGFAKVKASLTCYSYKPFTVDFETSGVLPKVTSLTIKSCKGNDQCSKLEIKDSLNNTHSALDCLDQNICKNSQLWCQQLTTGSSALFTACQVQCCDSNLCAKVDPQDANQTVSITVPTPDPVSPSVPRATCSIFAPFEVNFEAKQVSVGETKVIKKVCENGEMCGGVTLLDAENRTHHGSDCVSQKHCQNAERFCKTVIEGSKGTFRDCRLKCCNGTLCLDPQEVNFPSPKCYHHSPFIVDDGEVKTVHTMAQVKFCQNGELCSRGIFEDYENKTHISLDCLPKPVCENPSIICQHFSGNNPESPFVGCNVECCQGDFCFSNPSSTTSPSSKTSDPSSKTSDPSSLMPTTTSTFTTTSSKTRMEIHGMLLWGVITSYVVKLILTL